jgi:hypothetical protein
MDSSTEVAISVAILAIVNTFHASTFVEPSSKMPLSYG